MTLTSNPASPFGKLAQLYRSLGPGIMLAAAAVGGSHLVASTQAGAIYGWQLVLLIILVNLFKYPFFIAGVQYTMGTGKSLVQGYREMGKGYLLIFTLLTGFSAFVSVAALLLFSASLLALFIPFSLSGTVLALIILLACLIILMAGHFKTLDSLSKIIMLSLTLATLAAVIIAAFNPVEAVEHFEAPSPWTLASIGFVVATMGWMPAPIEVSAISSQWLKRQCEDTKVSAKAAIFDFNVGYIGTALLAVVFVALGALVLHGSDVNIASSGAQFSQQLVNMYANTIGQWARYLIAIIAFFCIFGSALTCLDGYARIVAESTQKLANSHIAPHKAYNAWLLSIAIGSMLIVTKFTAALMPMLNFAMIVAFMTTPFFALMNYILVSRTALPKDLRPSPALKLLSLLGLVYLFGFLLLFIWWKWLM